jgi:hypothetical protein
MMCSERGLSFAELLAALGIALLVVAAVVAAVVPSPDAAVSRAEVADMQQRLRVATDAIAFALGGAGAGAYANGDTAALINSVAPIVPYRFGGTGADPPGTYKSDTITLLATPRAGGAAVGTTFWLKSDNATATYQLMVNDTTSNLDVPVADHVVALRFEYFGDPQPPTLRRPLDDPAGPGTSYGPAPAAVASAGFAAGENCIFVSDASGTPQPRLAELGPPDSAPINLASTQLTDGPWCPSGADPNRWDADLLRIRSVAVTIRVEAAPPLLRGPAGALFVHGGTSRSGLRWVPDQEIRFQISPRNMNR